MIEIIFLLLGWIVTVVVAAVKILSKFKKYVEDSTTKNVLQKTDIYTLKASVDSSNSLIEKLTDKIDNLKTSLIVLERDIIQLKKDSAKIEKKVDALSEDVLMLKAANK